MATDTGPGEVIEVLKGTVNDLQVFVDRIDPEPVEIEELLEMEKHLQDRKSAREFLEKEHRKREVTEDISEARHELSELRTVLKDLGSVEHPDYDDVDREEMLEVIGRDSEGVKDYLDSHDLAPGQLKSMKHIEKLVNDRKTVKEALNEEISKEKFHQDVVEVETDVEDLEEDLEELENDSPELVENLMDEEKDTEGENDGSDKEDEEDNGEKDPDEEGSSEADEDEDTGEDDKGSEDENDDDPEFERKKELVRELDVEIERDELEQVPIDQLESLKEEKDEREKMIDELSEEGLSEPELRQSSTSDLRKLSDEVEPDEEKEEVDTEALEDDARTDLDFIRGAVPDQEEDEEEEKDSGIKDRLHDFQDKLSKVTSTEAQEDAERSDRERLEDLLDEYQKLENSKASVKIAQVLKGYLEKKMKVSRELTYGEMSDRLEQREGEDYQRLAEFFSRMQIETYTGRVSTRDVDDVVDSSLEVADDLER